VTGAVLAPPLWGGQWGPWASEGEPVTVKPTYNHKIFIPESPNKVSFFEGGW